MFTAMHQPLAIDDTIGQGIVRLYEGIQMTSERDERRSLYLKALDHWSNMEPYAYWAPEELVTGYSEAEIQDAIRYLEEKGLIEVIHSIGDRGLSPARITAYGQDFLSNAEAYRSDRTLGSLANATIHFNTTNVSQSTVGSLVSGGSGHTLSGAVTVINHPQANAVREAFKSFDTALAGDRILDNDVKDEIVQHEEAIRDELSKPIDKQDRKKIARRWERITPLIELAPPLVEFGSTISKLLLSSHGS